MDPLSSFGVLILYSCKFLLMYSINHDCISIKKKSKFQQLPLYSKSFSRGDQKKKRKLCIEKVFTSVVCTYVASRSLSVTVEELIFLLELVLG